MIELVCGTGVVVDWNAASAMGSFLAVVVALIVHFHTFFSQRFKDRSRESVRRKHFECAALPLVAGISSQLYKMPTILDAAVKIKVISSEEAEALSIDGLEELADLLPDAELFPFSLASDLIYLVSWGRRYNRYVSEGLQMHPQPGTHLAVSPYLGEKAFLNLLEGLKGHAMRARNELHHSAYGETWAETKARIAQETQQAGEL